jgi:hypothetical protein
MRELALDQRAYVLVGLRDDARRPQQNKTLSIETRKVVGVIDERLVHMGAAGPVTPFRPNRRGTTAAA